MCVPFGLTFSSMHCPVLSFVQYKRSFVAPFISKRREGGRWLGGMKGVGGSQGGGCGFWGEETKLTSM